MQNEDIRHFQKQLLGWYDLHARPMPWRTEKTPYRVWISEVMLQQTRVETVIPFFDRFITRFPTVESLAEAEEDALLKTWEGLGYYRRARNLQTAARGLAERNEGFPTTSEGWESLPGIGPYAAGAIASIAFGDRTPAVDGNVIRVLSRFKGLKDDFSRETGKRKMREIAKDLLPVDRVGDFNQALMELGALVCLPNGVPKCWECPLQHGCRALAEGDPEDYPRKSVKSPNPEEPMTVMVIEKDGVIALRRRPDSGLLGKLWEFPGLSGRKTETEIRDWAGTVGIQILDFAPLGTLRHAFTHKTWVMDGYYLRVKGEMPEWRFVSQQELRQTVPLPAAFWGFRDRIPKDSTNSEPISAGPVDNPPAD